MGPGSGPARCRDTKHPAKGCDNASGQANARAVWALECHQRILQCPRGRRPMPAVLELAAMRMQILRGRVEHRRAMDHRRIDKTLLRLGVAAGGYQRRFRLKFWRSPVIS